MEERGTQERVVKEREGEKPEGSECDCVHNPSRLEPINRVCVRKSALLPASMRMLIGSCDYND